MLKRDIPVSSKQKNIVRVQATCNVSMFNYIGDSRVSGERYPMEEILWPVGKENLFA